MVIDDESVGLLRGHAVPVVGEAPVHAGDCLEQPMLPQRPVQVQNLLDRRIEAGQEHVHDHQDLGLSFGVYERPDDLLLV